MKKKSLLSSFILIVGLSIYMTINTSYSGVMGGTFNSYSNTACTTCHGTSAPTTSIAVNGLPANYNNGQSYPLSVTITNAAKVIAGFQIRSNIGTITTTDPGINVYSDNRSAGHNSPKGMTAGVATFNVIWTAPATGSTIANFGAQGIGANGNGGAGGDSGDFITISNIALPVRFVHFSAKAENGVIKLFFETQDEKNIKKYLLERKSENNGFRTIQEIAPKGNGQYELVDQTIEPNKNYLYRIVEEDLEGQKTYSKVISAQININNDLAIYPTIVKNNILHIKGLNTKLNPNLILYSITGNPVLTTEAHANISLSNTIAKGLYIAHIRVDDQILLTQKLSIQ
jgi:hypothetical protein